MTLLRVIAGIWLLAALAYLLALIYLWARSRMRPSQTPEAKG